MKRIMVALNTAYQLAISLPGRQLALFELCGFFLSFFLRTHKYLTSVTEDGAGEGKCM